MAWPWRGGDGLPSRPERRDDFDRTFAHVKRCQPPNLGELVILSGFPESEENREGTQVENLCYEEIQEGTQVENLCYWKTCATRSPERCHRRPAACHGEKRNTPDPKNTPDWDRTSNLQLRRLTLYPIELREQRTCGSLEAAPRPRKQRRFSGRTTTDAQPAAVMPTA